MKTPVVSQSQAMQRLLVALAEKANMSANDLSRDAFVGLSTLSCGGYLKALLNAQQIHISGWRKARNGFVTPLYSLGNAPNLPRPKFCDKDRDSDGLARIVNVLREHRSLDYRQIALYSGLSANTIKNARYMDILIGQGRAHVSGWRRNKAGPMAALYSFGSGNAAPRPEPLSAAEKCLRARKRRQALGGDRSFVSQLMRL